MNRVYSVFTNDNVPDYEMRWYGGTYLSIYDAYSKDEIGIVGKTNPSYTAMKETARDLFGDLTLLKSYCEA